VRAGLAFAAPRDPKRVLGPMANPEDVIHPWAETGVFDGNTETPPPARPWNSPNSARSHDALRKLDTRRPNSWEKARNSSQFVYS
jgi:hypothetical protein